MDQPIAVIGTGYVGGVVAGALAYLGHDVVAVERDPEKLAVFQAGGVPVHESGLEELMAIAHEADRIRFVAEVKEIGNVDIVFLCVGTPQDRDGDADLTAIRQAAANLGEVVSGRTIVVTKSTVPIGTNFRVQLDVEKAMAATGREGSIAVVSNPEFLRTGTAVGDFLHPDRVVLGSDDEAAMATIVDLYQPILRQELPPGDPTGLPNSSAHLVTTDLVSAELIKYAANSFLAVKISYINEMAQICELVGADIETISTALGLDHRISPLFLRPGLGYGGSCLGKDLASLTLTARELGYSAPLLEATRTVNELQRGEVVRRLRRHLGDATSAKVALLGLAFKPGTDDVRDAPALHIAQTLHDAGLEVVAYDPVVRELPANVGIDPTTTTVAASIEEAVTGADAVALITEWPEFTEIDWPAIERLMRGNLVIDGRNALDPDTVRAAGLTYEGIGRPYP
ncbi:MAG: UDP-glucose/GDP-mannose dehydrogenase family protein [bacterium]|nr:UDP-glucose/GDP-mannose dehydrogenase family protein [bacterium]